MENNVITEKTLAYASLGAAADLIFGVKAGLTTSGMRTRMKRVAGDLMDAAGE